MCLHLWLHLGLAAVDHGVGIITFRDASDMARAFNQGGDGELAQCY